MMGDERLGCCSARKHRHHGRLDFHKTKIIQKPPDEVDDTASSLEKLARAVVHDQIKISLAIARFLVLQAIKRRRKLMEVG